MRGLLVFLIGWVLAVPAWAERHAFIVGNAAYTELRPLANTHADVAAYGGAFEALGFDVTLHTDLGLDDMADALDVFLTRIAPGDEVVFVYAGHGWSDGATNYLVPVDAPRGGTDRKLKRQSMELRNGRDGILDDIAAMGASLTVAVIDACRDNPFEPPAGTRSAALSRGLARETVATGTFVIFSAGAGQEALDRLPDDGPDERLSVFTRNFVPQLARAIPLEDAVAAAQEATAAMALGHNGHLQHPAYYDQTLGKTCLAESCAVPAAAPAVSQCDALFDQAKSIDACFAWEAYAAECGTHTYTGLAASYLARNCTEAVAAAAPAPEPEPETMPEPDDWLVPQGPAPEVAPTAFGAEATVTRRVLGNHEAEVWAVDISHDGRRVLTGSNDGELQLRDIATGDLVWSAKEDWGSVETVLFDPTGEMFLSSHGDGRVRVWDAQYGVLFSVFDTGFGNATDFAFDRTGGLLATGGNDGVVRIWDVATGELTAELTGHVEGVWHVAFNGDAVLSLSFSGRLLGWHLDTGEVGADSGGTPNAWLHWAVWEQPSGQEHVVVSQRMNQAHLDFAGVELYASEENPTLLDIGPDWRRLAGSLPDGRVVVWHTDTGYIMHSLASDSPALYGVAFGPDGRQIVAGGLDGTVWLWQSDAP